MDGSGPGTRTLWPVLEQPLNSSLQRFSLAQSFIGISGGFFALNPRAVPLITLCQLRTHLLLADVTLQARGLSRIPASGAKTYSSSSRGSSPPRHGFLSARIMTAANAPAKGTSAFSIRAPLPASCSIYTDPYALSIGSLQLITSIRHLPATVLSGHAHTFKLYSLSPARAPEVGVGNSGDSLAATPGIPLVGATVGTSTVTNATPVEGFGFATVAPAANGGWTILAKDSTSATTATCTMQPTLINCTK